MKLPIRDRVDLLDHNPSSGLQWQLLRVCSQIWERLSIPALSFEMGDALVPTPAKEARP